MFAYRKVSVVPCVGIHLGLDALGEALADVLPDG